MVSVWAVPAAFIFGLSIFLIYAIADGFYQASEMKKRKSPPPTPPTDSSQDHT